jgi:hypothetical protein
MSAEQVLLSFLYVEDSRIVLVFDTADNAKAFTKSYDGRAEVFTDPTHVFLNKPLGLQIVRPSKKGETIYVFNSAEQASAFAKKLDGHGFVSDDAKAVTVGRAWSS